MARAMTAGRIRRRKPRVPKKAKPSKIVKASKIAGTKSKKKTIKKGKAQDEHTEGDKEVESVAGPRPATDTVATMFQPFPRLPFEIRLKIWGLMAPKPNHTLSQIKPLDYKPLHTYFEARPTPVVMHVCRESRAEFLYSDDEAANSAEAAERKGHALYAPLFPNPDGKEVFFSFESDALHLLSFNVAEPLVRSSLRTIVMGPSPHLTKIFHGPSWQTIVPPGHSRSWYIGPTLNNYWLLPNPPPGKNDHTLIINEEMYPKHHFAFWDPTDSWEPSHDQVQATKIRRYIKYDFRDLVKFTSLEKLIVLITKAEVMPENPREHIVWKTLEVVKAKIPNFKLPSVEFQLSD